MSSVRVLVGTKKGALILTKQEILDSKADPGLPIWIHSNPGGATDVLNERGGEPKYEKYE